MIEDQLINGRTRGEYKKEYETLLRCMLSNKRHTLDWIRKEQLYQLDNYRIYPRYADATKQLKAIKIEYPGGLRDGKYAHLISRPVILMIDYGVKRGAAIFETIIKPLIILGSTFYINCHYSSSYFNAMTALYKAAQGKTRSYMKLVTTEKDALSQALSNIHNRDWRIIELRELMVDKDMELILINNAEMAAIKRDVVAKIEQNHANPSAPTPSKEPDVSEYEARYLAKKELLNRVIAQTKHRLTNTIRIIGKKRKLWMNMPVRMMSSRVCLMLTGTIKIEGRLVHYTVDGHKCECGDDTSSTLWLEQ